MKEFLVLRTDMNHGELMNKHQAKGYMDRLLVENGVKDVSQLPIKVYEIACELDVKAFMLPDIQIGDVVRFGTGVVCLVVPNGEAVLYQDVGKITISDVKFYYESEACHIVSKEKYLTDDGLIMEVPTHNLRGILGPGSYAVCNENEEWEVFHSDAGLYQVDDFGVACEFHPEAYMNRTWTIKEKMPK